MCSSDLVTSPIRAFPQVPTFAQQGFPQANLEVFFAIFGPAGLPQDVLARLVPAFERTMKNPAYVEKMESMGFSLQFQGPKELATRLQHELQVVGEVVKKAGIKGE